MSEQTLTKAESFESQVSPELEASLLGLLDEAITLDGADKGNIQLFNSRLDGLEIVASRGFDRSFLELFRLVRADEPSACGRAFRQKRRVTVPDIHEDAAFAPYITIACANGCRAVQSTPILGRDQSVLGIFSTHFNRVHQLSESAGAALDDYAQRIARLVETLPD